MRYTYMPALAPGKMPSGANSGPLHCTDARLPPELRQTSILASYYLWKGRALPFADLPEVLGDSGGFSVVSSNAVIDPRNVIRWQLKNCTHGVILDIPPYRFGRQGSAFTGDAVDMWRPSLARTTANVRAALPFYEDARRDDHRFRWWGVVQGQTFEQMQAWHAAVANLYAFQHPGEGWALSPKPENDIIAIARFMRFARANGFTDVHVFQAAAPLSIAVMIGLGKLGGLASVSNDSATAERNAGYWNVFVPAELGGAFLLRERVHFQGGAAAAARLVEWCSCYSCALLKAELAEAVRRPRLHYVHRITLHNFLGMKAVAERILAAAESDADRMLRTVLGKEYGNVMREWEGASATGKQFRSVSIFDRLRAARGD